MRGKFAKLASSELKICSAEHRMKSQTTNHVLDKAPVSEIHNSKSISKQMIQLGNRQITLKSPRQRGKRNDK